MEITWNEIESMSEGDKELQSVRQAIESTVWPSELRAYESQKKYLHVLGSLLFKDDRVVLPHSLRIRALNSAHGGHVGEIAMKRIMRAYFWWPNKSMEVSRFVKGCQTCIRLSRRNPPLPLASRELPTPILDIYQ